MTTITSTTIADREGFVAHLRERAAESHRLSNDKGSAPTQKAAAFYRGRAEGLELAAILVSGWQLPPADHSEDDPGVCILCGAPFTGYGHNPEPLARYENGRACGACNGTKVIPARLGRIG